MVHRIQNRNPGYSDFSGLKMSETFNFQTSTTAPVSDGATALKLEDEVHVNNGNEMTNIKYSENINEPSTQIATDTSQNSIVSEEHEEEKKETVETEPSNGLENFGLQEEESFELFDNNNNTQNSISEEEKDTEEDELEIPAFLRRQKN